MLLQLHHSPTINVGNPGSSVPVAQGVAMLKPPESGRSRREQAVDETETTPPVESADRATRNSLETPDAAEAQLLQALKRRDRAVRTHEQAHAAVAGPYARGGPVYEYQRGPNGQMFAVGGHVKLDTSPVAGDPQATLDKAETLRRAAMAPAQPSAQDRRVAAEVAGMALEARAELRAAQTRERSDDLQAAEATPDAPAEPEARSAGADSGDGGAAQAAGEPGRASVVEQPAGLDARLRASGALPRDSAADPAVNIEA